MERKRRRGKRGGIDSVKRSQRPYGLTGRRYGDRVDKKDSKRIKLRECRCLQCYLGDSE